MQQEEEFHACPKAECPWGLSWKDTAVCEQHADSDVGAFFAKDDGNIFVCRACEARYCLACEVPFHEEQTCEEYQVVAKRRSEEEEKSLKAVK